MVWLDEESNPLSNTLEDNRHTNHYISAALQSDELMADICVLVNTLIFQYIITVQKSNEHLYFMEEVRHISILSLFFPGPMFIDIHGTKFCVTMT